MKVWRQIVLLFSNTVLGLPNTTTTMTETTTIPTSIMIDHGGLYPSLNNISLTTEAAMSPTLTAEVATTKPMILKQDYHQKTWLDAIQSCSTLEFDFCKDGDSHSCLERIPSHYDLDKLPTEFTAWVASFLMHSYSVVFLKCIEIDEQDSALVIKQPDVSSIEECVLKCANGNSDFEHLGWLNGNCSCVYDALVHPFSNSVTDLGHQECTETPINSTGIVINLYKYIQHTDLSMNYCPSGAHLGTNNIFSGVRKCDETLRYYCKDSDQVRNGTWEESKRTCSSLSSRIMNLRELKPPPTAIAEYWIQGFNVQNLALGIENFMDTVTGLHNEYFDETKCTAIKRNKDGNLEFLLANCSSKLPSLCEQSSETTWSEIDEGNIHLTTEKHATYDDESDHVTVEEIPTAFHVKTTLSDIDKLKKSSEVPQSTSAHSFKNVPKPSEPQDDDGRIFIALGCTAAIVIIVVIVVLYRRYRHRLSGRKPTDEESYVSPPYESVGYPYDIENDTLQAQNRRYLPSVMSYPADYGSVGKYSIITNAEGSPYTAQVNATVHNDPIHVENSEADTKSKETEETEAKCGSHPKLDDYDARMVSMSITEIDKDLNERSGSFYLRMDDGKETKKNPYPLSTISVCERRSNGYQSQMEQNENEKTARSDGTHSDEAFSDGVDSDGIGPACTSELHEDAAENEVKPKKMNTDGDESEIGTDMEVSFQGSVSINFTDGDLSVLHKIVHEGLDK